MSLNNSLSNWFIGFPTKCNKISSFIRVTKGHTRSLCCAGQHSAPVNRTSDLALPKALRTFQVKKNKAIKFITSTLFSFARCSTKFHLLHVSLSRKCSRTAITNDAQYICITAKVTVRNATFVEWT